MAENGPVTVEYLGSRAYNTALPPSEDPFRHLALANSHNHHDLHPWGKDVMVGSQEFDALYAEANNRYLYHVWYTPKIAPYMATELISMVPITQKLMSHVEVMLKDMLASGIDTAIQSPDGQAALSEIQNILNSAALLPDEKIFVRLSATSNKDSFALNVPTAKPDALYPDAESILRRLLTSGRSVGRLFALADNIWRGDPGEAIIIQKWSPDIELAREIRVFCCDGRVTAISQDIWWEKMGWRERYSEGFVSAITSVWDNVKGHLPFDTCTMDVLVNPPSDMNPQWGARVIEFNGFGAHLNTGSDLFHWVNDHDILYGKTGGITVRFVDDWEEIAEEKVMGEPEAPPAAVEQNAMTDKATGQPSQESQEQEAEPDWLVLEKKLREKYADSEKTQERLDMETRTQLPLRGRWCSAY